MTSKTEQIYFQMLDKEVVTLDDVERIARKVLHRRASRAYLGSEFLTRFRREGKIRSIRRGLYHVVLPVSDTKAPDLFLVASKVRPSSFLGFHTALEFYGSAHSLYYNESYVCGPEANRFRPFSLYGVRIRPVVVRENESGIAKHRHHKEDIRVSSKERTVIDCVERPEYCGGWEEVLNSLMRLDGLRFRVIRQLLLERENQFLLRQVGIVLEILREASPLIREAISNRQLLRLAEFVQGPARYFFRNKANTPYYRGRKSLIFSKRWRTYVPVWLTTILGGGLV
ncbi:MAG: type IV toxin-antitoxin system AbiEi family antitoxin [Candidatus Thorarchaeota archaeon]